MKNLIIVFMANLFFLPITLLSQNVDVAKLVEETQQVKMGNKHVAVVWWIPNEYWEKSFKDDPTVTEEMTKEFIEVFNEYLMLAVIDSDLGPFGGVKNKDVDSIKNNIRVILSDQTILKPLPEEKISGDASNFISMIKPMFTKMMGQFGSGMNFILFRGVDEDGKRLLDPGVENRFEVNLYAEKFSFRLPLGSLLPDKYDPETGEIFPGNYNYNPYTGVELELKKN